MLTLIALAALPGVLAAHETEKMHYRVPTTAMSTLHWWDCHPNPKRGQP